MTIHFIYAKGLRRTAPHSITRHLAAYLSERAELKLYDLAETRAITPAPGDILLGHPHHDPRTIFAKSFHHPNWAKRFVLCPYSHGIPEIAAFVDPYVEHADLYLAITGKYWFNTMKDSPYSHWAHKTRRLDLAVDRAHFPRVKKRWNPPGRRKFLYIGYAGAAKGTDYLAALADANPDLHFAWMGGGLMLSEKIETLGPADFTLPESLDLVSTYDFILSTGRSDANPTTLLEGLSWGLVPICTPQSGYHNERWCINIPLDDLPTASAILHRLNHAPESDLDAHIHHGTRALAQEYTWPVFGNAVWAALHEPCPPTPTDPAWSAQAIQNRQTLRRLAGGPS